MFNIKKIKTMQFLAKNSIIFILIFGLYACTKEPANTPVSLYCGIINEKLYSFSRLSDFEKKKFDELKKSKLATCITKGHLLSQSKGVTRLFGDYSFADNGKEQLEQQKKQTF